MSTPSVPPSSSRHELLRLLMSHASLLNWPRDLLPLIIDYAITRLLLVMNYREPPSSREPSWSYWQLLALAPDGHCGCSTVHPSYYNKIDGHSDIKMDYTGWIVFARSPGQPANSASSTSRDLGQGHVVYDPTNAQHATFVWNKSNGGYMRADDIIMMDMATRTWNMNYKNKIAGDHQHGTRAVDHTTGELLWTGGVCYATFTHAFNPRTLEWKMRAPLPRVSLYSSTPVMDRNGHWYVFNHSSRIDSLYYQRYDTHHNRWHVVRMTLAATIATHMVTNITSSSREMVTPMIITAISIFPAVAIPLHHNHTILLISMQSRSSSTYGDTDHNQSQRFYSLDLTTNIITELDWKWPRVPDNDDTAVNEASQQRRWMTFPDHNITASHVTLMDDTWLVMMGATTMNIPGHRSCWMMNVRHNAGHWQSIAAIPSTSAASVVGMIDEPSWWNSQPQMMAVHDDRSFVLPSSANSVIQRAARFR